MKKMFIFMTVFCLAFFVSAQRASFITEMLEAEKATYGEVSYLSAVYQGFVNESASYDEALETLQREGQVRTTVNKDAPLSFRELSAIMAKLWNIKGGLMFRITKGSGWYSFRQFKIDGVISNDTNPSKKVSGIDVLNLYTACQQKYGGNE